MLTQGVFRNPCIPKRVNRRSSLTYRLLVPRRAAEKQTIHVLAIDLNTLEWGGNLRMITARNFSGQNK